MRNTPDVLFPDFSVNIIFTQQKVFYAFVFWNNYFLQNSKGLEKNFYRKVIQCLVSRYSCLVGIEMGTYC